MPQQNPIRDITQQPVEAASQTTPLQPTWGIDFTKQSPAFAGLSFSRASSAGYYDKTGTWVLALTDTLRVHHNPLSGQPYGYLAEESRTNYLLNSTAPANQTVSIATGTYTLWTEGTGSCLCAAGTAVGSGFGTATAGAPVSFTLTTAGTVTFSVSGSVSRFQCEKGATATSFITTAGASATRSADICNINLATLLNPAEGTFVITGYLGTGAVIGLDNGSGDAATRIHIMCTPTLRNIYCSIAGVLKGTFSATSTLPGNILSSLGISYSAAGLVGMENGRILDSNTTNCAGINVTTLRIGHRNLSGGIRDFLNSPIQHIHYYNKALSREQLQLISC